MSSIRLRAIDAWKAEFDGLKPAAVTSYENRLRPLAEEDLDAVNFRWETDVIVGADSDTRQREITAFADCASATESGLDALIVLVQKAGETDPTLGGLVAEIAENEVRGSVGELGAEFHMAVVEVVIRYSHTIADPEI